MSDDKEKAGAETKTVVGETANRVPEPGPSSQAPNSLLASATVFPTVYGASNLPSKTPSLSEQIYNELTSQRIPIQFKQLWETDLQRIIDEVLATERDLENQGICDVLILYNIATPEKEYSGASKEQFAEVFRTSAQMESISIQLSADWKKQNHSRKLEFKATRITVPGSTSFNEIFVLGNEPIWVSNTYARMQVALSKIKNANSSLYSNWMELLVQLLALLSILTISIKITTRFGRVPGLNDSQIYVFATALLFGSNVWTFLSKALYSMRAKYFPVVGFKQKSFEGLFKGITISMVLILVAWVVETLLNAATGTSFVNWLLQALRSLF